MTDQPGPKSGDWFDDLDPTERAVEALVWRIGEAIEAGDEEAVMRALAEHADLAAEHPGAVGIHLDRAVELGRAGAVAAMLLAGASASWADENRVTPLMVAALHGRLKIARMLLEAGADPDDLAFSDDEVISDPSLEGHCALFFALVGEHPDLVGLLGPLTSPGVRELAEQAVQRESDREPVLSPPVRRLFRAVARDDAEGVAAALAEGADPECSDEVGTTPLAYAAMWDKPAALAALLKGGAGVDALVVLHKSQLSVMSGLTAENKGVFSEFEVSCRRTNHI